MKLSKIFPSILVASAGFLGVLALLAPTAAQAQEVGDEVKSEVATTSDASFWKTFHHGSVVVNGIRLHYVEGGSGAPVLLIPGWPESWYAWRFVMPTLVASGRRVIAVDPRGFGDSDRPQNGYDLKTIAVDMHAFVETLGLAKAGQLDVVGHDVGVWIGYAYAADWPGDIRRLALFEAALPGVSPPAPAGIPSDAANLRTWQFAFNRLDDLPETLIHGHEHEFLIWLFREKSVKVWGIGPSDLSEYVRVLSAPGAARAGFAYYREAFTSEGLAQSRERAGRKLAIPVLAIGAETGVGDALLNTLRSVAIDVRGGTVQGCGHYIMEECPEVVDSELRRFWSSTDQIPKR